MTEIRRQTFSLKLNCPPHAIAQTMDETLAALGEWAKTQGYEWQLSPRVTHNPSILVQLSESERKNLEKAIAKNVFPTISGMAKVSYISPADPASLSL